jgi:hypothetical protein
MDHAEAAIEIFFHLKKAPERGSGGVVFSQYPGNLRLAL